jgi:hypothetical protein
MGNKTRCVLALISMIGTFDTAAHADSFDKYRVACQADQKAAVAGAINEARTLLTAAQQALPPTDPTVAAKFKRWFGNPVTDNNSRLKNMYIEIAGFLKMKNFWCPNAVDFR